MTDSSPSTGSPAWSKFDLLRPEMSSLFVWHCSPVAALALSRLARKIGFVALYVHVRLYDPFCEPHRSVSSTNPPLPPPPAVGIDPLTTFPNSEIPPFPTFSLYSRFRGVRLPRPRSTSFPSPCFRSVSNSNLPNSPLCIPTGNLRSSPQFALVALVADHSFDEIFSSPSLPSPPAPISLFFLTQQSPNPEGAGSFLLSL